jgi:hypothetical protein
MFAESGPDDNSTHPIDPYAKPIRPNEAAQMHVRVARCKCRHKLTQRTPPLLEAKRKSNSRASHACEGTLVTLKRITISIGHALTN